MKKGLKTIVCIALSIAMLLTFAPLSENVFAAKKSVVDVISDAAGTTGEITSKTKEYIVDRYALDDASVSQTAGGWNDDTGAAVAVVKCKSTKSAKDATAKFKDYIKTNKEAAESYGYAAGSTNEYLDKAYIGRVGKYAVLVMLSKDKAKNKAGFAAVKKKL